MKKYLFLITLFSCLSYSTISFSQSNPPKEKLVEVASNLVKKKFANASCQDLSRMMTDKKTGDNHEKIHEEALKILKNNPEMREEFINQVAGTIVNKMFDCDLIP